MRKRRKGIREPNGRLSRRKVHVQEREEMTEAEAKSVVLAARRRHGAKEEYLDLNDAGRPNWGTVHGRMYLEDPDTFTRDHWQAAEWYIGKRIAWLRSIKAPCDEVPPHFATGQTDEDAYADWCKATGEMWSEIMDCLQEASTMNRSPVIAAFDVILIRSQYVEHMVGDLRVGLNAIHRRFLAGRRKAA